MFLEHIPIGRGPDMTLVHPPPPPYLSEPIFFEPLGCPEYGCNSCFVWWLWRAIYRRVDRRVDRRVEWYRCLKLDMHII